MVQGPQPVEPAEIERRKEYLAPLYAYLRAQYGWVGASDVTDAARLRAEQVGEVVARNRLTWINRQAKMRQGECVTPPWFIEQCCAVIGKPVSEVMGAEWVKRFGADGRGGTERAPVRQPRQQKPWSRSRRPGDSTQDNRDNRDNQAA